MLNKCLKQIRKNYLYTYEKDVYSYRITSEFGKRRQRRYHMDVCMYKQIVCKPLMTFCAKTNGKNDMTNKIINKKKK